MTSAAADVINHNGPKIGRFKPMRFCYARMTSAQWWSRRHRRAWADVILADFQRVISRYLQDISTYLSCTAQRVFRTVFMQKSKPKYACLPSKIVEVWIDRFCVRYDWWRWLQPTSSVSPVWFNKHRGFPVKTITFSGMGGAFFMRWYLDIETTHRDSFYLYGLTLIPAWKRNYIHYNVWGEITYPFPNFSSATVEVREWISDFIPQFTEYMITYPCWV